MSFSSALNIAGSRQHKQSICEESFKPSGVSLCAPSKYNFLIYFLILHTYQQWSLFSSFMSVYGSIIVACYEPGWEVTYQILDNLPVGIPWKKSIPLSQKLINSSNRGGTSWARPQSMMEFWQDQLCLSCAGTVVAEPIYRPWWNADGTNLVCPVHVPVAAEVITEMLFPRPEENCNSGFPTIHLLYSFHTFSTMFPGLCRGGGI